VLTRIDASELDAITGAWLFRQAPGITVAVCRSVTALQLIVACG
jgi:hypothetical protein